MEGSVPASAKATPANGPVEKKVKWSTVGSYLGGVAVLAILNAVSSDPGLISGLPDFLEAILVPVIPALVTFATGYKAKHTPRPDLGAGGSAPPRRYP